MRVAWHEVPGLVKKKEPVPEGRCDLCIRALVYKDRLGIC